MSVERRATTRGVRWDVRLRTPDGKQYRRSFRTKREAEAFEAREVADRSRGAWIDPRRGDVLFGTFAAQWLGSNPGKRPSTWARDEGVIRVHLEPELGKVPVAAITPADVQALVSGWSKVMAPRTVARTYGVLRSILNAAVARDIVARTPCRGIKLPKASPAARHVVTADELAVLHAELDPGCAPMVYLGAVLGLRWGECAGLRVGRVDFLGSTLAVVEQLTRGKAGRGVLAEPKSDAGRRTLAVPRAIMDLLAQHLHSRGLTGADDGELVFASPEGGPLEYSNWRRRQWLPAAKAAGVEGLGFHDLRRANATALVREGVDVKTAQARLGHSDPRLTLAVYAQAVGEADRSAADKLGEVFLPGPTSCAMDVP